MVVIVDCRIPFLYTFKASDDDDDDDDEGEWATAWALDWRFIICHHVAILKAFVSQNFKVKSKKTSKSSKASGSRAGMIGSHVQRVPCCSASVTMPGW